MSPVFTTLAGPAVMAILIEEFFYRLWRALLRVLFLTFAVAFVSILIGVTAFGLPSAIGEDSVDHRLAAVAAVFAAGGFLLAVLAVVVAILAYNQSIKRPKLAMALRIGDNTKTFTVATLPDASGTYREVATNSHSEIWVTLTSKNRTSARNPAVKVTIGGGFEYLSSGGSAWFLGDRGSSGAKSAQWDGGANYIVHGGLDRELPALPLGGARLAQKGTQAAWLQIQWVADGIPRQTQLITIGLSH